MRPEPRMPHLGYCDAKGEDDLLPVPIGSAKKVDREIIEVGLRASIVEAAREGRIDRQRLMIHMCRIGRTLIV
jgi:hypothetical protein